MQQPSPTADAEGAGEKFKAAGARAAGEAAESASEVVDQVRDSVRHQGDSQIDKAAVQLNDVAGVLRQTGDQLRNQQQGFLAEGVERVAQQTQNLARYLQQHSFDEVVGELQNYTRRNPALVLGGAVVAGFLGARFLKASGAQSGSAAMPAPPVSGPPTPYPSSPPPLYSTPPRAAEPIPTGDVLTPTGVSGAAVSAPPRVPRAGSGVK